jgi:hypothetical protein
MRAPAARSMPTLDTDTWCPRRPGALRREEKSDLERNHNDVKNTRQRNRSAEVGSGQGRANVTTRKDSSTKGTLN